MSFGMFLAAKKLIHFEFKKLFNLNFILLTVLGVAMALFGSSLIDEKIEVFQVLGYFSLLVVFFTIIGYNYLRQENLIKYLRKKT